MSKQIEFDELRTALRSLPPTSFSATGTSPGWHTKTASHWLKVCRSHMCRRGEIKTAELGGSQDTPFEQAFSNLAHSYLKDKAPKLLDFEVGFQLMEKNQENTKAIGVIGFKVGPMWVYVPVFFLNGDLKGHEMMYLKNQDHFIPLNEGWVDHVLGKKPSMLGDGVNRNLSMLGIMPPNLYQLSRSPQKFASADPLPEEPEGVLMSSWFKDFMPKLAYLITTPLGNEPKYQNIKTLPDFLKEAGEPALRALLKIGESYPDLIAACDHFYGPEMLTGVATGIAMQKRAAEKRAALSICGNPLSQDWNGTMQKPSIKNGGVRSSGEDTIYSCDNYKPSWGQKSDLWLAAHRKEAATRCNAPMPPSKPSISKPKKKALYSKPVFKKRGVFDGMDSIIGPLAADDKKHKVISKEEVDANSNIVHSLSDGERKTLLKERVVFRDTRDKKDVTIAYDVQTPLRLYNPDQTNVYWVLTDLDQFEKCLVIKGPYTSGRRQNYVTVVRLDGKKGYCNTHPANVWCRAELDRDAWKKWYDGLEGADSLPLQKKDDKYGGFDYKDKKCHILLTEYGDGTVPFRAREKYTTKNDDFGALYAVRWEDHRTGPRPAWLPDHGRHNRDPFYDSFGCGSCDDTEQIALSKKPGGKFHVRIGGQLFVPHEVKRLTVRDEESTDSANHKPLRMGSMGQMQAMVMGETSPLRIVSDGKDVEVNEQRTSGEKEAVIHLFRDYGLTEETAKILVKRALFERHVEARLVFPEHVKYAADPGNDMIRGAPNAPPFPEPNMGYDPMTGGNVPTMQESEFNFKVPDMSASKTDRSIYYPFGPDPKAMQSAQQAAQSGQKEVFDTTMLGGLLKAMRQDTLIDQYMGDLMKGLDRLGRLLFQYYWHGEQFEERYGKQDMPELEDGLRNSFEGLGDIILALKKKGVDMPYDNSSGDDSDLKALASN